jgi:hypothetical protein
MLRAVILTCPIFGNRTSDRGLQNVTNDTLSNFPCQRMAKDKVEKKKKEKIGNWIF